MSGSPLTESQGGLPEVRYVEADGLQISGDIEEVTLTPEDENNPALLAELEALHIKEEPKRKAIDEMSEEELKELTAELKSQVLSLKRSGDIEGAKDVLLQYNAVEGRLKQIDALKGAVEAKKVAAEVISVSSPPPQVIQESLSSPKPKDAAIYRDLFAKLQKQSAQCVAIAESYSQANRPSDAKLFIRRKQAFDLDIQKMRLMLKEKKAPPASRVVDVIYENQLNNPDVPEGILQITLGDLKITNTRKCKLSADGQQYQFKISYELPGLDEKEVTLTSQPFTTTGLERNTLGPFTFKCNRKDIRVIKGVEYKKLRLEIVAEEGILFFKSTVVKMSGQAKLDRLLKDCSVQVAVDLMDVDGEKRSALPSAMCILTARVRAPLSGASEGFKRITEKWIVVPEFGNSNHVLYSCLSPPPQVASPVKLSPKLPEMTVTGTLADKIRSFEVIEYELEQLAQKPVSSDPELMDLQVALEGLRDRLQMQVEIGELSITGNCCVKR